MKRSLAARHLEELTGDDIIDTDELVGPEEEGISATLHNAIYEVESGGASVGKAMKNIQAHVKDAGHGTKESTTYRLGKLSGKNASRDWWRTFKDGPAIETIRIPIKYKDLNDGLDKFRLEDWPILDPHSIANFLWTKGGMKTPEAALEEYWNHNSTHGEPWAQNVSPDVHPIGIYGDSARVNTKFGFVSVVGIYFNCVLWKPQSVRASRFLVCSIPEHQLWKHFTLNCIYRRIAWSITALVKGIHPESGPYGEALPKHLHELRGQALPHRCKLTEVRGDWSWHKKIFRFERCSWNGIQMCHHCPALAASQDAADLYWNFENNNWDSHLFSLDEFIDYRMPRRAMCPLVGIPGFHPSVVRWCLMHVCDLGLLFVCNGSSMNLLLRAGWFGSEPDIPISVKLSRAYVSFKDFIKLNKIECSQPEFTENMIFKKNSDVLFTAKAFNGRVVLEWLCQEVYRFSMTPGAAAFDPRVFHIAAAMKHMSRFLGQLEQAGRYLTENEANSIFDDGKKFLDRYVQLTAMSVRFGHQEWFLRPKCHALWHMLVAVKVRRSNIRFFHGFVDEDGMAWLKCTYARSHPRHAIRWIMRCGRLRIWSTHLKVKKFNQFVAARLAKKR